MAVKDRSQAVGEDRSLGETAAEAMTLQKVRVDLVLDDAVHLRIASADQVLLHLLLERERHRGKLPVDLRSVGLPHLVHAVAELVGEARRTGGPDEVEPLRVQRGGDDLLECPLSRQQLLALKDSADDLTGHVEAGPSVVVLEAVRTSPLPGLVLGQGEVPAAERVVGALVALLESQHRTRHEQLVTEIDLKDARCKLAALHATGVFVRRCAHCRVHRIPVLRDALRH
mmetsp:Transcript_61090/g.122466  ORF Transcript_61090/g.122466 Transcript_61090/m.122466 type:complete len:228 (+) Transcript_61090:90-773(+)